MRVHAGSTRHARLSTSWVDKQDLCDRRMDDSGSFGRPQPRTLNSAMYYEWLRVPWDEAGVACNVPVDVCSNESASAVSSRTGTERTVGIASGEGVLHAALREDMSVGDTSVLDDSHRVGVQSFIQLSKIEELENIPIYRRRLTPLPPSLRGDTDSSYPLHDTT